MHITCLRHLHKGIAIINDDVQAKAYQTDKMKLTLILFATTIQAQQHDPSWNYIQGKWFYTKDHHFNIFHYS